MSEEVKTRAYTVKHKRVNKNGELKEYIYTVNYKIPEYQKIPKEQQKKRGAKLTPATQINNLIKTQPTEIQQEILAYIQGVCLREITTENNSSGENSSGENSSNEILH